MHSVNPNWRIFLKKRLWMLAILFFSYSSFFILNSSYILFSSSSFFILSSSNLFYSAYFLNSACFSASILFCSFFWLRSAIFASCTFQLSRSDYSLLMPRASAYWLNICLNFSWLRTFYLDSFASFILLSEKVSPSSKVISYCSTAP